MDDNKIVELYWQRNEQAIKETSDKYGSYCMKISLNILSTMSESEEMSMILICRHGMQCPRIVRNCSWHFWER